MDRLMRAARTAFFAVSGAFGLVTFLLCWLVWRPGNTDAQAFGVGGVVVFVSSCWLAWAYRRVQS